MTSYLRRREVIALLGGTAAWPFAARAQQATPVVGFLHPGSPETTAHIIMPFREGLRENGYVEGRNLSIEFRWAHDDNKQLPGLAADLVRRQVAVIATPASTPAALAAKAATTTIPIVFQVAGDPIQSGLVASLNRPGGNITGLTSLSIELAGKRLAIMHELVPGSAPFAVLVNPNNQNTEPLIADIQAAATAIARPIEVVAATTNREIDLAFARLAQKRIAALLVTNDALFVTRRVQVVALAIRHTIPALFYVREWAVAGGFMSYGTNLADQHRQVGVYAGRILRGEKPADLPVMQASKFELVINLQIARILGIDVPTTLLARADEVIE